MALDETVMDEAIKLALAEDLGDAGDVTTKAAFPESNLVRARIVANQGGVVAGVGVAHRVFQLLEPRVSFIGLVKDGDTIDSNATVADVTAPLETVFSGERVALNFMQRMSGIASLTAKFVAKVRGYPARIYDTRKTGPGLRAFDKYAVSAGGGANHRLGLYDAVLIKDNHVRLSGSIEAAVTNVRNSLGAETEIEVEVETLAEVLDAIRLGADVILLDNMSLSMVENAVDAIGDKAVVEVSGGVTLENVEAIAQTGVARISVGRITQGAEPLDMALEIKT